MKTLADPTFSGDPPFVQGSPTQHTTMNETMTVIHESDALDTAYQMGYNTFSDSPESDADPAMDLSHYKDGAYYINNVAPKLRLMAGFSDHKGGTYQDCPDTVAVIPVGSEDDRPIEAVPMDPRNVLDAIQEAYDQGAYDALNGYEYGENDHVTLL